MNFASACQDHILATRIQVGIPRNRQTNENGKCLTGKKTYTTFMWILRAPVRITFLPQGSKLATQGTATSVKIENVQRAKKHKRFLCEFWSHLPVPHFCSKDPSWDTKGAAKGMKMENVKWLKKHKRLLCEFCARLSGSYFCCKDPNRDPKGQPKEWTWEMFDG